MPVVLKRDLSQFAAKRFDLLVVGGGIYGAWAALDAAQRGLGVALIERSDFGAATSANHQRIIHGGLRYLQHADLARMRQSVRERSVLLRIAPDLVRPLPVLVPTTRGLGQHRAALGGAFLVNDLLSFDRNRGLPVSHRLPRGRLMTRREAAQLASSFDFSPYTGGAVFYDAQVLSPERLVLDIIRAAVEAGAVVANHVAAEHYLRQGQRVCGVAARDRLHGESLEVESKLVLNCTGPWTAEWVGMLDDSRPDDRLQVFKAAVLVVRDLGLRAALAVPGRVPHRDRAEVVSKGFRNFFLTPWRGLTLVGTFYAPHEGTAADCGATDAEIDAWLAELNAAWPGLELSRDDVLDMYVGLLPRSSGAPDELDYAKHYVVIDHEREGGPAGVVSLVGVKFTTARAVAAEAIDLTLRRLQRPRRSSRTDHHLEVAGPPMMESATAASARLRSNEDLLRDAVVTAVQSEMACTLADVVFRRTELAVAGYPGDRAVAFCAAVMGPLRGWDQDRIEKEIQEVHARYYFRRAVHGA